MSRGEEENEPKDIQTHSLQKSVVNLTDKALDCTQEMFKVAMDLSEKLWSPVYICSWFIHL